MAEVTEHDVISIYIATLPETRQFLMVDPSPEKDVWSFLHLCKFSTLRWRTWHSLTAKSAEKSFKSLLNVHVILHLVIFDNQFLQD